MNTEKDLMSFEEAKQYLITAGYRMEEFSTWDDTSIRVFATDQKARKTQ
jgi:hypothetical protein